MNASELTVPATSDDALTVTNPGTGHAVGTVPNLSAAAVAEVATKVRAAQPDWSALGHKGRKRWLLAFQDWIIDHAAELADTVQSESGKPRVDAEVEVAFIVDLLGYWSRHAGDFLAEHHPRPHTPLMRVKRLTVAYSPYPVVGIITPWNFPLGMPAADVVPALAAGAGVVLKPSDVTPLTAVLLAKGWAEIGAPSVFAVATGDAVTGAAVVDQADYVQFTGSTATGKKIASACAATLTPYSLELGGKDPAVVLRDADIDRAVHGIAYGALVNTGQLCVSIERVYVEAPVYDRFVRKLVDHVNELRTGTDGRTIEHDIGPLATEAQLDIVTRHVDQAVAAGATVLTGGKRTGSGTFYLPTVLTDVDHTMECMTEETFGPIIPVMKVADEEEAITLANDSRYGLSASVWTTDKAHGHAVARRLFAGTVNINDSVINLFNFTIPHGGWGQSGTGSRWGGAQGVRKFCRQQALTSPALPVSNKEMAWFPYVGERVALVQKSMRAFSARGKRRFRTE
ncbi:aldehyde dehydrogenase family protein [Rhodococcus sp. NPDC003318]|uniref:aldehyde dehydrogenase family protein n=1 Tax=Rhodococcus sp. NPDC003318 TaxID=3364503 RepID=UPI0036B706E6